MHSWILKGCGVGSFVLDVGHAKTQAHFVESLDQPCPTQNVDQTNVPVIFL